MSAAPHTSLATRRAYAELLRHFLAGRMITDDYEDATYELLRKLGSDDAVDAVFDACWHLYDDIKPHRMTGPHHISGELRRRAARWVLFLRGGAPYPGHELGPDHPSFVRTRRAKRRDAAWALWLACTFGGLAMVGVSGSSLSVLLFVGGATALLLITLTTTSLSVHPEVLARAFSEEPDPWPFASDADLNRAIATPTFLHG